MKIKLSDHFTYGRLIRFVFPSIVMMIFTSIYNIVDGLFISNYVGKLAFASVNLVMPYLMIASSFGFMMGTGGSAIIAKTLGEQEKEKANQYFSLIILTVFIVGILISTISAIFMPHIASFLGATKEMLPLCTLYGRMILISLPFFTLQTSFQSLCVTAEKPKLGLFVTVFAGCMNIVLDFLLVGYFKWGIVGAAMATITCETLGGFVPLLYFSRKNTSLLQFTKPVFNGHVLLKSATNGASEFMSNISGSIVSMVYNMQLLRFAKENGVAAYGAIMYVNFIFIAIFIGYSIGSAPTFGYNYGAQNHTELKNILKKSIVIVGCMELMIVGISLLLGQPIMKIFVGYDDDLYRLTVYGFSIYCLQYILCGFNIFTSSFFTALNNGKLSAIISFFRTLVFQLGCLLILPLFFQLNGVWMAVGVAETFTFFLSIFFVVKNRNIYHYM